MLLQPGLLRHKIGSVPLPTSVLWYTLFCFRVFIAIRRFAAGIYAALQPACRAHWAMLGFRPGRRRAPPGRAAAAPCPPARAAYPQITASRRFASGSSTLRAVWRGFGRCTNTPSSNSTRSGPLGGVLIQLEQVADVPHPKSLQLSPSSSRIVFSE